MSLVLASQPHFCLVLEVSVLGLIIGLAIGRIEFISGEIAISFSKYSLWKVMTGFQKYCIAKAGSQIFFPWGSFSMRRNNRSPVNGLSICWHRLCYHKLP